MTVVEVVLAEVMVPEDEEDELLVAVLPEDELLVAVLPDDEPPVVALAYEDDMDEPARLLVPGEVLDIVVLV
jgi:hypothetical protein